MNDFSSNDGKRVNKEKQKKIKIKRELVTLIFQLRIRTCWMIHYNYFIF